MNNIPTTTASIENAVSHTQAVAAPRARVLAGYFAPDEIGEYLLSIGAVALDPTVAREQHAVAHGYTAHLAPRDDSSEEPFPDHAYLTELRNEPTFAEHATGASSLRFAWVEVEKLAVCQPRVDWTHVERLSTNVPPLDDEERLLRFCMPLQRDLGMSMPPMNLNPVMNTLSLVFDNPDVRVCGPIQGIQPGTGRALLGFAVGPGLRQMSAVSFGGRLMINNGYHRAVALAVAGHRRIPLIVKDVPGVDATPAVQTGMFKPQLVFGPRAPRVTDFLSPAAVEVATRRTRLFVSVHAELHPVSD